MSGSQWRNVTGALTLDSVACPLSMLTPMPGTAWLWMALPKGVEGVSTLNKELLACGFYGSAEATRQIEEADTEKQTNRRTDGQTDNQRLLLNRAQPEPRPETLAGTS